MPSSVGSVRCGHFSSCTPLANVTIAAQLIRRCGGMKNQPAALAFFEDAIAFRKEQGKADEIRVAEWCFARALRSMGRLEEALAIQRRLESEGTEDGFVAEELGELLAL